MRVLQKESVPDHLPAVLLPCSMFYHGADKVEANPYAHADPKQKHDAHGGCDRHVGSQRCTGPAVVHLHHSEGAAGAAWSAGMRVLPQWAWACAHNSTLLCSIV